MAAELCLHLARRLAAGSIPRRDLIDRGIQMSTMANERNTTADGLIKHILAHEAHKGIDDRLLELRREDDLQNTHPHGFRKEKLPNVDDDEQRMTRETSAAIILQSQYRKVIASEYVKGILHRMKQATTIQSFVRGFFARELFKRLRYEKQKAINIRERFIRLYVARFQRGKRIKKLGEPQVVLSEEEIFRTLTALQIFSVYWITMAQLIICYTQLVSKANVRREKPPTDRSMDTEKESDVEGEQE